MDCGQNEAAMAAYACCRIQSNCKLANQDGSNGFPVFKHQFLDWLVDTTTTLFFHLTMLSKKCQLFYKMCNNVYIVRGYQSLQAAF